MSDLGNCPTEVNVQPGKISHMGKSPTGCCYHRVAVPTIVFPAVIVPGQLYSHIQCDGMLGGGRVLKTHTSWRSLIGPLPTKSLIS